MWIPRDFAPPLILTQKGADLLKVALQNKTPLHSNENVIIYIMGNKLLSYLELEIILVV